MAVTATFHFAAQASRAKYLIAPSASVTATGDSVTGIGSSAWSIVGAAGSETSDWVISSAGTHSCVVTAPSGTNKAAILQRVVTSGNNRYVSTAKLYSGTETICTNETDESDQDAGWAPLLNLVLVESFIPSTSDFNGLVSLTGSTRVTFEDVGVPCVLGLDTSTDFIYGAEYELTIPAGTASSLSYADNLDPESSWDPFDSGVDYWIGVSAIGPTSLVSAGKALTDPAYPTPTIVSAEVDATDLDKLTVTFSEACHCPSGSIVGLSLGGTMSTPRTITAVDSGNGTTAIVFDLSGDLDLSDAATFVIGASRELRSLNGPKPAAGSTAITFANLDYDWGGIVTGATFDLIASAGIGVADGAVIPSWTDQIASEAATEATNRPIYRATGVNGFPAVEFDGTNDKFLTSGADVVSDWMGTPGDFEIIAVVQADTVTDTVADFDCHGIWNGVGTTIGMGLYRAGGVTYTLLAWVYDGVGYRYATAPIGASLPAHGVVCEMRLTGGNLIASVDGVDGTPVASGAPLNYGGYLRIGSNRNDTVFLDGKIARIVGKSGNGTKETAAINAFIAKYQ